MLAPGAAVKNSRDGCEQDVGPIEMGGAFIEVRESEEDGRDHQRRTPSDAALQQVLQPGAKVELFGDGSEEKYSDPAQERAADSWQVSMGMDESQRETQRKNDWGEEKQFAQAGLPVAPLEMKIEAGPAQAPDGEKSVQACIYQK